MADAASAQAMQAQYEALFWQVATFTVPAYSVLMWCGAILAGMIVMMCLDYVQNSHRDPYYLKVMAVGITALQVASAVFEVIGHTHQTQLVLSRTIAPGVHLPWTDAWIILTSCLSGIISQCYFGRLVWRMTRATSSSRKWSYPWVVVFAILSLAVLALGCTSFVFFVRVPRHYWIPQAYIVNLAGFPANTYIAWLAAAATLDTTLSVVLITNFVRDIRRDGFETTNSILQKLAISTLETFSLTAFIAIIDIICAALIGRVSYISTAKLEVVCYVLTVFIERAYAASFIFTLKRHGQVRDMRNAASNGSAHKSFGSGSPASTRKSPARFNVPRLGANGGYPSNVDGEAAIELRSGNGFDDMSQHSYVDGIRVETTHTTAVEKADDMSVGNGRQHFTSWKTAQGSP